MSVKKRQEQSGLEVAVIGMAGRFPGAQNVREFWSNLINGVESTSFFDDKELMEAGVEEKMLNNPQYIKAKAVLDQVEYFDADFFGYSPIDAQYMDPQARIFLETAWEALEDAGYNPYTYKGNIGLYAGTGSNFFWEFLTLTNDSIDPSSHFARVQLVDKAFFPTRISYNLNLKGPSLFVFSACSTSLVTIHMACRALLTGECKMALAGGVSISLPHKAGYLYQEGMIASPDGHCRPFDAQARGTIGGQGAGVVVLKSLKHAIADKDHIYAVIKGSAINNDGYRKVGYTAPSIEGQAEVIRTAHKIARTSPESIGYIEAHGTGTTLGDPIEFEALRQAFNTDKKQFCYLGSVKSNFGHLDSAAGVAGFIKTVLALKNKKIPPSLHFNAPNPKIGFENSPFLVNDLSREWHSEDNTPLRAGVSSFGIGGTNAHVVLEEAPELEKKLPDQSCQIVILSAKTKPALKKLSINLQEYLKTNNDIDMADVAYTLAVGRAHYSFRKFIVTADKNEAVTLLSQSSESQLVIDNQPQPVFIFAGEAEPSNQMARFLYETEPLFKEQFNSCAQIIYIQTNKDIRAAVTDPTISLEEKSLNFAANFCYEYALAQLLIKWGIKPKYIIGYGFGEYVAACLAEVISKEDALSLILGYWEAATSNTIKNQESAELLENFKQKVSAIQLKPPQIPYLSNSLGNWITADQALAVEYWLNNLQNKAKLGQVLDKLRSPERYLLINCSGGPAITDLLRRDLAYNRENHHLYDLLGDSRQYTQTTIRKHFLTIIGSLWDKGAPLNWEEFYASKERYRVSLPTYPFERKRYWINKKTNLTTMRATAGVGLTKKPNIDQWFYLPSWKQKPLPPGRIGNGNKTAGVNCLLFIEENNLTGEIIQRFQAEDFILNIVKKGGGLCQTQPGIYTINSCNEADYRSLIQELQAKGELPDLIIHMWSHTDNNSIRFIENQEDSFQDGFYSLLFLGQALAEVKLNNHLRVRVVSNYVQAVTEDELVDPIKACIVGPCLVINQEFSGMSCKFIDLPLTRDQGAVKDLFFNNLLKECCSINNDLVVAYRGNQRWVKTFEPVQSEFFGDEKIKHLSTAGHLHWKQRGVYLITGGFGNIGMSIAKHLAETVRAKIVLIGRASLPHRKEWEKWLTAHGSDDVTSRRIKQAKRLEEMGAEVLVFTSDLSSQAQLEKIVRNVEDQFGTINGVIHAAGKLGNIPIAEINKAECEAFFQPKIEALITLYQVFKSREPEICILMSSVASILGGLGFVAYTAANQFMDAMAGWINKTTKTRWISVNWDGWQFESSGGAGSANALAITPEEGILALHHLLEIENLSQVVVSTGDLQARIDKWVNLKQTAEPTDKQRVLYDRPQLNNEYIAPRNDGEIKLAQAWQEVLGFNKIGINDNFYELGGDSLKAMQIVAAVENYKIAMTDILKCQTIAELSQNLKEAVPTQLDINKNQQLKQVLDLNKYPVTRKRLKDMQPFNEALYKDCFYNAFFPVVFHFKRSILPVVANEIMSYGHEQRSTGIAIEMRPILAKPVLDVISDLKLKMETRIISENIVDDLIQAIINDHPVVLNIDCFYEPNRRDTFKKQHWSHYILIFGFDLSREEFDIIEHSNLNILDYSHKTISFSDLIKAYEGYLLNFQKGESLASYFEFMPDTTLDGTQIFNVADYQISYLKHFTANQERIVEGLRSLALFKDGFSQIISEEELFKKKTEELITQLNEVSKAKTSERYGIVKLFEEQSEIIGLMDRIIDGWTLVRVILEKYRITRQYDAVLVEGALGKTNEIINWETEYLSKMSYLSQQRL